MLMHVKYMLPLRHQQIWCIHSWQSKACWANSTHGTKGLIRVRLIQAMFRHKWRHLGHGAYGALNNCQHHKKKKRCELISHF